ncbi:MAG: hypothetical protein A2W31_18115 [Planctomycetes bacterium RBG_16_64_10]|nr:MAG: hypothetical protein A2W31_18115 [Planctomycetes bacterium RBG_16_64_10]
MKGNPMGPDTSLPAIIGQLAQGVTKRTASLVLVYILGLGAATPTYAANVSLGKPVELIGEFGTGSDYLDPNNLPPLPPASMVTDGVFQSGWWTEGVWWDEGYSGIDKRANSKRQPAIE